MSELDLRENLAAEAADMRETFEPRQENGCGEDEELILQCVAVLQSDPQSAGVALLQRRLRLGYTRAARIMDELEGRGIVGPARGAEPRQVLLGVKSGRPNGAAMANRQSPIANRRKFRLALYTPNAIDGTALVRSTGPLLAMAKQARSGTPWKSSLPFELEIVMPQRDTGGRQELTWDWLASCDALMVQRPYVREHLRMILTAKQLGLKVWVDWDDDYTCVRDSNPHRAEYSAENLKEVLTRIARNADVVTVTTAELKRRVESWLNEEAAFKKTMDGKGREIENGDPATASHPKAAEDCRSPKASPDPKVRVVPNGLHFPFADFPRQRVVTWRGGASHDEDVLALLPWMEEVCRMPQFSKWDWHFMGEPPWQVKQQLPAERVFCGFGADPFFYMQAFARLAPWVHMVPLADHGFNRAKSNLAWIEATAAGAVVLAPDWEEWRKPGIVNYRSEKDFAIKLRELMGCFAVDGEGKVVSGSVGESVSESRKYIREHLTLERVNEKRWQILEEFAI